MKIISEYKLDNETIKDYRAKGYEIFYGYEDFKINPGESVGFLLDSLYKNTIDMIVNLLYRKTKSIITLKMRNESKVYKLDAPFEWEDKIYDSATNKTEVHRHPILTEYLCRRQDYFERRNQKNKLAHTEQLIAYLKTEPNEDELQNILDTYSYVYEIPYDDTKESKLEAYMQIKYYLDNDVEYCRPAPLIDEDDEGVFQEISFGDETYLEDYIYKNQM